MAKESVWPASGGAAMRTVTPEMKQRLSASLQELMKEREMTHTDLAEKSSVYPGSLRDALLAKGFVGEKIAKRLARALGVPIERLLTPQGAYTPYEGIKSRNGEKGAPAAGAAAPALPRKYNKKKPNGHDDHDPRWLLPAGIAPPHVKIETSKGRPGLNTIEIKAEVPPEVAMGVYSMMNQYRVEETDEQ